MALVAGSLTSHQDHPLLRRFLGEGCVVPLLAQFPSTTALQMTTLHTGQAVGAHGIYEWHVYEPLLDRVICPVSFSYAGDEGRETPTSPSANVSPTRTMNDPSSSPQVGCSPRTSHAVRIPTTGTSRVKGATVDAG
jgi:hypothetical protein